MNAFEIIPFILFIVVIGTTIAEKINVPYPLILVIAGIIVGFIPGIPNWHPPSNLVLILFLPPILFAAARVIAWDEVKANWLPIFSLSIVLVVVNALAIAITVYWAIPFLPFSAALVLGAIISPTDATAATSILNKMNAKQSLVRTLEIESLFNDAISIVLYTAAVGFVFTGDINLSSFTHTTIFSGVGGIIIGIVFSYFTRLIVEEFLKESENELPIIMSFILAYVAYLFADKIGVSGVLAVVTAGLFHRQTERAIHAQTRLKEKAAWDTYIFFLNGLIFIVIGLQFPVYLNKVTYLPIHDIILYSCVPIVVLVGLRLIWLVLTELLAYKIKQWTHKTAIKPYFSWRDIIISSWSGMRGIVSLALAIALPVMLSNSVAFPYRELIIFMAVLTIMFTLIVQGLTLPFLVKLLRVEKRTKEVLVEVDHIYHQLTRSAMAHLSSATEFSNENNNITKAAKKLVNNYYANRMLQFKLSEQIHLDNYKIDAAAANLLYQLLEYERSLLHSMLKTGRINQEIYIRILHKIDRDEFSFAITR